MRLFLWFFIAGNSIAMVFATSLKTNVFAKTKHEVKIPGKKNDDLPARLWTYSGMLWRIKSFPQTLSGAHTTMKKFGFQSPLAQLAFFFRVKYKLNIWSPQSLQSKAQVDASRPLYFAQARHVRLIAVPVTDKAQTGILAKMLRKPLHAEKWWKFQFYARQANGQPQTSPKAIQGYKSHKGHILFVYGGYLIVLNQEDGLALWGWEGPGQPSRLHSVNKNQWRDPIQVWIAPRHIQYQLQAMTGAIGLHVHTRSLRGISATLAFDQKIKVKARIELNLNDARARLHKSLWQNISNKDYAIPFCGLSQERKTLQRTYLRWSAPLSPKQEQYLMEILGPVILGQSQAKRREHMLFFKHILQNSSGRAQVKNVVWRGQVETSLSLAMPQTRQEQVLSWIERSHGKRTSMQSIKGIRYARKAFVLEFKRGKKIWLGLTSNHLTAATKKQLFMQTLKDSVICRQNPLPHAMRIEWYPAHIGLIQGLPNDLLLAAQFLQGMRKAILDIKDVKKGFELDFTLHPF